MLRFGGITADENVAWTDAATPRPAWASSVIGPAQLRAIGELARRSGWRILLTVGLAHYEPTAAAREVAAAHRALGPYLAAVEIGNEPNAYGSHGLRELPWIAQGYEEEVSNYREAIQALTPGVPIAGPDVSGSGVFSEWGDEEALAQTPVLLTGHHYPLGCAQNARPLDRSAAQLRQPRTRGALAGDLHVGRARQRGPACGSTRPTPSPAEEWPASATHSPRRCGPPATSRRRWRRVRPASTSRATPRTAPDTHPSARPIPAALATGALRAQPEWYALLLTSSLVG